MTVVRRHTTMTALGSDTEGRGAEVTAGSKPARSVSAYCSPALVKSTHDRSGRAAAAGAAGSPGKGTWTAWGKAGAATAHTRPAMAKTTRVMIPPGSGRTLAAKRVRRPRKKAPGRLTGALR